MATKTIVSLFDDFTTAQRAARALIDAGYPRENISVIANDVRGEYGNEINTDVDGVEESDLSGVGVGAGVGATLGGIGGLLVGLGAVAIPGIGPVVAAGPLITALLSAGAGAGIGAVAGGLVGALVDAGVPEEEAGYFAEGIRRGGALLTVQVADEVDNQAMHIINRHQPVDMEERAASWREKGWSGFDASATPYASSEMAQERTSYRSPGPSARGTGYGETSPNDPDYESRGWTEVEPGPGEESYRRTSPSDPDHTSRGWAEVEPGPGEQTYRDITTGDPNYSSSSEGWTEVEPGPGEESYRRTSPSDPDHTSRGWAEVEPPMDEQVGSGQVTSRAWSETTGPTTRGAGNQNLLDEESPTEGRTDIGNRGWANTKDPAEGRADIDPNAVAYTRTETSASFDTDDDYDYDYDLFETRFREHYNTNYTNSGYTYDIYAPAYRFGYDLAYDIDFEDRPWGEVEPEARSFWEANYEGLWDQFKDSVRHAWEETKEAIGLEEEEDDSEVYEPDTYPRSTGTDRY